MTEYAFTVVVDADDEEQAKIVLGSRIMHDEDLSESGVEDYTIDSDFVATDADEARMQELSEAAADLTEALRKLYEVCDDDELAVGEVEYECHKAARSN